MAIFIKNIKMSAKLNRAIVLTGERIQVSRNASCHFGSITTGQVSAITNTCTIYEGLTGLNGPFTAII